MSAPVQPHPTPNPNAHKYVLPGRQFARPLNLSSAAQAAEHPLAVRLFALDGVYNVFLAQDFVTVNKRAGVPWEDLEPQVLDVIAAWLRSLEDVYSPDA